MKLGKRAGPDSVGAVPILGNMNQIFGKMGIAPQMPGAGNGE